MENKFKNRRKNYFINKKFQRNFILKFCVIVIVGSVISGSIIYMMSRSTVTTTFEDSRLAIKSTAGYILPAVLLSSAVVVFLTGLATIVITLFTSHRIAGPLYRLEKDVEEVARGNLTKKFHLRRADEIKALAENLDLMTDTLRAGMDEIKRSVSDLESSVESADAKEKLKNIRALLAKFIT